MQIRNPCIDRRRRTVGYRAALALSLLLAFPLLMGQGCGGSIVPGDQVLGTSPDSIGGLDVAKVQQATWLVMAGNDSGNVMTATAFGLSANRLGTNAHVVDGILDLFSGANPFAQIVQHETGEVRLITRMWKYPSYDAQAGPGTTPDVGLLEIVDTIPVWLQTAGSKELFNLEVFDDVSLCGFPGDVVEGIDALGIQTGTFRPRVTCLTGTISALRPLDPGVSATPQNTKLIQYDLSTTPGTSGSAVMSQTGHVIGVNSFGFLTGGAYNFAMRVDLLSELIDKVDRFGLAGTVLTSTGTASTQCSTTFYDPQWKVGFNLPLGWAVTQSPVSDLYSKAFASGDAQLVITITTRSPDGLSGNVSQRISALQGDFDLLLNQESITSNGKTAHLLQWVSKTEDLVLLESFSDAQGGVLWLQGNFPITEFDLYVDSVGDAVLSSCAQ